MARRCTVCAHPSRPALDAELAVGTRLETLSKRYRVSLQSLSRHRRNGHVPQGVIDALRPQRDLQGLDLEALRRQVGDTALFGLSRRRSELDELFRQAKQADQLFAAAALARECREYETAILKLTGEIAPTTVRHIHAVASQEWLAIRAAVVRRARERPELRQELLSLLEEVEHGPAHLDGLVNGGRLIEAKAGADA